MKRPEDMSREELEDEVIYLRSELGLAKDATRLAEMMEAFGLSPSEAELATALYGAGERVCSKAQLLDAMPQKWGGEDRADKIVDVFISKLRNKIGKDAIVTVWGLGYHLSPGGVTRIREALAGRSAAA